MRKYFNRKSILWGVPISAILVTLFLASTLDDSSRYERLPDEDFLNEQTLNEPNSVKNSIEYKVGPGFWNQ